MFVIFDEGFIHKTHNLFIPSDDKINTDDILIYLKSIPKISLIINFNADYLVCLKRLKRRGLPFRLKNSSETEIINFIKESHDLSRFNSNKLPDFFENIQVLNIENNLSIKETSSNLYKAINGLDKLE